MPVFRLDRSLLFPPAHLAEPEGLLAIDGDLSVPRLIRAYSSGIFPWYNEDEPILWWSPDPRAVLYCEEVYVARSMRPVLNAMARGERYEIRIDSAFETVMDACRNVPRRAQDGTWIGDDMIKAYQNLHRAGHAHSVEVWNLESGELAGGLYGVAIGSLFCGESMFALERDTSKMALIWLAKRFLDKGLKMIDCQILNPHLERMGVREIPRIQYLRELEDCLSRPEPKGLWTLT